MSPKGSALLTLKYSLKKNKQKYKLPPKHIFTSQRMKTSQTIYLLSWQESQQQPPCTGALGKVPWSPWPQPCARGTSSAPVLPFLTHTQAHHTILAPTCNKSQRSPQFIYQAQVQICNYLWDSYLLVNARLPDLQSQMPNAVAGKKHSSIRVCKQALGTSG